MAGRPDPKPRRRIKVSRHRYQQMRTKHLREHPLCECGCRRRSETIHHVVRRGHGDDVYANFMALAGDGVRGCHGALTSGQRVHDDRGIIDPLEVKHRLRARMETVRIDTLEYVLRERGRDWLDKTYPARPGSRQSAG